MKFHDHITDSELLEQFVSSGCQAAFATLVQRHGAMVRAVAMRVLANHHDAQDVTQAVFIKLAKEAGKLMGQASVAGWLHTVSRRLSLNARLSRESRQKREHAAMNRATTADTANEGIAIGFRRELDAALDSLPERYRQPLVLFHLEGAPLHKCAELLELHPATLRTRLSRARDMLRGSLVRRGVEVASVAGLASLLAAEAKAGVLPPALVASILDTASGGGAAVSPAVLKLANTTVKFKSAGISTLILTPLIIMKTKTIATAIAALIIAALCTTTYIVRQSDSSDSANRRIGSNSTSPSSGQTRATKKSVREATDHLSQMSQMDFHVLFQSVYLISDDAERLAAIREKLGMNISDEVYRKALAAKGYNATPMNKLSGIEHLSSFILSFWLEEDPSAAMQWNKRFSGDMRFSYLLHSLRRWMEIDPAAAMAWAEKNLEAEDSGVLAAARKDMTETQQVNADKHSIADIAGQMLALEDPSWENRDEFRALENRVQIALDALAKDDPQAALDACRSLDPKIIHISRDFPSGDQIYEEFARKDPAAAIASLMAIKSEQGSPWLDTSHDLMKNLYQIWAGKDPDAAIASAMSLNAAEDRSWALMGTLPSWQIKYPEKNIGQAADLSVFAEYQYDELMRQLVTDMVFTDPAAAAAYVMDVEDVEMKQSLIAKTAEVWAEKNSKEAERWVGTLPEGDLRDSGLRHVALWASNSDMAHVDRLVNQIRDPGNKDTTIQIILNHSYSNISRDFSATLKIADQLATIPYHTTDGFIDSLSPKDADHFKVWLRDAYTKGRLMGQYTDSSYQPATAEEFQKLLDGLKAVKAKQQ